MAMAPWTSGPQHSDEEVQQTKAFWRLHLTPSLGTATAEVQKKLQLPLRTRNVQLLGLTSERGHAAPLDSTLAVETLSRGGHRQDLADSNLERDHMEVEDAASDVASTLEALRTPSAASQTPQPRLRSRSSTYGVVECRCWRDASKAALQARDQLADREAVEVTLCERGRRWD